jgi:hypothetical protein
LNLRSDTLKPLVDIGVATRLRFLQQARQTIHKHRISEAGKVVIKNGNIAAHGGNGRADAAVFMSYLVSKTHVLAETFKDLYHCKPSEYLDQNEIKMLEQMLDCEATIMAVQRVNKSNESAGLRAEHSYLLEKLYNAQTSSASIAVWESSLSNKKWLERLEKITADIVRLDRKSSSSRKKLQPVSFIHSSFQKSRQANENGLSMRSSRLQAQEVLRKTVIRNRVTLNGLTLKRVTQRKTTLMKRTTNNSAAKSTNGMETREFAKVKREDSENKQITGISNDPLAGMFGRTMSLS